MMYLTRRIARFVMPFICLLASDLVGAQEVEWEFSSASRRRVTVPFKMVSNLIVAQLRVNGSEPLNFIVDTGVKGTIITELSYGDSLTLNVAKETQIRGLGGDSEIAALETEQNEIRLGGLVGKNQKILVLMENVFQLSEKLGMRINGIIGYEIFKNFIVEVNYSSKYLRFHRHERFKKREGERYAHFPLTWNSYKPYMDVDVVVQEREQSMHLLLDTGSSDAIWIFKESMDSVTIPTPNAHLFLGRGLGGDVYGHKARIKKVCFGDFCLREPIAAFPDSSELNYAMVYQRRNGSIGGGLLRRFNVFFDYRNSQITFRKNGGFSDPFLTDLSGLDLTNPIPNMPAYFVAEVREGSPADVAGVLPGDQIMAMNNKSAANYSFEELQAVLMEGPEQRVRMTLMRDKKRIYVKFRLKEYL